MRIALHLLVMAALAAGPAAAQTAAPSATAKPAAAAPAKPAAASPKAALIDINAASKEELDALPQIGAARAEAIIKGRPYKSKDDLRKNKIIPENAYNAIKDKIVAHQKS